eukprot:TRINITY_DN1230_c8_g1_i1.p1 TRINITY_DN1230_c8_g1~~TRINITY_DN1230_c8_g1_i1.p1  ORF type:complete len:405 (+),score=105.60 TRINITY_DN1230_c8_g1_i1:178-1392(+)
MEGAVDWRVLAPWLYRHVAVTQLPWVADSLDALPAAAGPFAVGAAPADEIRVLAAAAVGQQSALVAANVGLCCDEQHVSLAGALPIGSSPVLRSRMVHAASLRQVAAVKRTDGVDICDLRTVTGAAVRGGQGSRILAHTDLQSRRPRQAAGKSTALACQPSGGVVTFSDFARSADADEPSAVYAWDVGWGVDGASKPAKVFTAVEGGAVEGLAWVGSLHLLAAQSNGYLLLCDTRDRSLLQRPSVELVSTSPLTSAAVPLSTTSEPSLVAAGGKGGLMFWDVRNPSRSKAPFLSFPHADQEVVSASFCPSDDSLVASVTADGRIWIWDLGLVGSQPSPAFAGISAKPLPGELLFCHSGHVPHRVTDMLWHTTSSGPHVISADAGGRLHSWCPLVAGEGMEAGGP